jgi:Transposase
VFIREKKNKSGSVSIQILEKRNRKNHLIKTIGSSKDPLEISRLKLEAKAYLSNRQGQLTLPIGAQEEASWFKEMLSHIDQVKLIGPELLLGKFYDEIGFDQIKESLFRHLVISRIIYPSSKLKTVRYLREYNGQDYDVQKVYRYLDKLNRGQKEEIEQISYEHTLKVLKGNMSVVFYDVTTIYFEAEREDELRQTGFSKEGKHQHPQILLGLLVSIDGYPLAYEIFAGKKYEGHTMLPVVESFKKRFNLENLVLIADAGMLNNKNVEELVEKGHEFILGARLKTETEQIKKKILGLELRDGESRIIKKSGSLKLVVSYTNSRAAKDAFNRNRGMKKLEKALSKGKLTKQHINNRGYNKYLQMQGEVNISINYSKFEADSKWDGLKGYLTNTKLKPKILIKNYNELWKIERAFRISKTDLRIRPIYHRLQRRIEAHICISFAAYKVYKELDRQLKLKKVRISTQRAIELLKTIYGIVLTHPVSNTTKIMVYTNSEEQQVLLKKFKISLG